MKLTRPTVSGCGQTCSGRRVGLARRNAFVGVGTYQPRSANEVASERGGRCSLGGVGPEAKRQSGPTGWFGCAKRGEEGEIWAGLGDCLHAGGSRVFFFVFVRAGTGRVLKQLSGWL